MNTQHVPSNKINRSRLITSGLAAVLLSSMAFAVVPAKASPAGLYTCGANEVHTHLENQVCGR